MRMGVVLLFLFFCFFFLLLFCFAFSFLPRASYDGLAFLGFQKYAACT